MEKTMLIAAAGALWLWSQKTQSASGTTTRDQANSKSPVETLVQPVFGGTKTYPTGGGVEYQDTGIRRPSFSGVDQVAHLMPDPVPVDVIADNPPPKIVEPFTAPAYNPPAYQQAASWGGSDENTAHWTDPAPATTQLSDGRVINVGTLRLGLA